MFFPVTVIFGALAALTAAAPAGMRQGSTDLAKRAGGFPIVPSVQSQAISGKSLASGQDGQGTFSSQGGVSGAVNPEGQVDFSNGSGAVSLSDSLLQSLGFDVSETNPKRSHASDNWLVYPTGVIYNADTLGDIFAVCEVTEEEWVLAFIETADDEVTLAAKFGVCIYTNLVLEGYTTSS